MPLPNLSKVLYGLAKAKKPGLLTYIECEKSILDDVPWHIIGVQNTDPLLCMELLRRVITCSHEKPPATCSLWT